MADILSQEEIDALLEVVDDEDYYDAESLSSQKHIYLYDFKRPNRLSKEQVKTIRNIHLKFASKLECDLDKEFKTPVKVNLHSIEETTYGEFLMYIPSPSTFSVFTIGIEDGVLDIHPDITHIISSKYLEESDNTSEINPATHSAVKKFLKGVIYKSLRKVFKAENISIKPKLASTFNSLYDANQPIEQNEFVVMCTLSIEVGTTCNTMVICYPAYYMESKLSKVSLDPNQYLSTDYINSITKTVDVILGETTLPMSEVNKISKGYVLDLGNKVVNSEHKLIIDDTQIGTANIEVLDKHLGVKVKTVGV
jgi:flagellar motor switch protein FliM